MNKIKKFFKDSVNFTNIKSLLLFIFVPYLFTHNWMISFYWSVGYIAFAVIMWSLLEYKIIKIKPR